MSSKRNLLPSNLRRALAAALLTVCLTSSSARAIDAGASFPAWPEATLEGKLPEGLRGRVLLVDFWASWCTPCKASFPVLSSLQEELGSRGLTIVGVSVDEEAGAYQRFLKRHKPAFTTVRDAGHVLSKQVGVPTMPTSVLVDRQGVVRFVHTGFHAESAERLRADLLKLLEEKP